MLFQTKTFQILQMNYWCSLQVPPVLFRSSSSSIIISLDFVVVVCAHASQYAAVETVQGTQYAALRLGGDRRAGGAMVAAESESGVCWSECVYFKCMCVSLVVRISRMIVLKAEVCFCSRWLSTMCRAMTVVSSMDLSAWDVQGRLWCGEVFQSTSLLKDFNHLGLVV